MAQRWNQTMATNTSRDQNLSKKITVRVGEALEGATEQMESAVDRAAERQSLLAVSAGKARHIP